MGMKKVNGKVYYSGTSASPITTKLNIYEVKNGRPNYITQTEFAKSLRRKSINKMITKVKNALKSNKMTSVSVYFKDIQSIYVFTYLNSFSYFPSMERPDLLTRPDIETSVVLFNNEG